MTNVSGTTITLSQALTSTISGAALVFSSVTTTQTRTFAYDSAGRLTSAANPENGTVTYTYNTTNTLATKTDAKGQQTAYTYDSKNRVTEVQRFVPQYGYQVEDVCQRVTYTYDTNPVNVNFSQYSTGRLTTVTYYGQNASGGSGCGLNPQIYAYDTYTEMYSYLAAGAVTAKNVSLARALGGAYNPDPPISLEVDYTYDSAGRTLTSTYPMGFQPSGYPQPVLTTGYDAMGRPSSLTDSYSDDWVSGVRRDYAGRLTNMSWLYEPSPYYTSQESRTYNGNGQLASINWPSMGIQYNYSATQNNGQITQEVDNGTAITYQYDPLKRLTSASGGATQTFQYDGFGNLTQKVLNGTSTPIPVNPATNQLTNAYYDANGNMTSGAGATFTYDEANRVTTVTETSGGETFYGYDASNKRIYERDPRLGEVFIFFGAKGEKLGRYGIASGCYPSGAPLCFQAQVTNVWFAGRLVATTNAGGGGAPVYQDRLGTNRATGGYYQTYYPYGDGAAGTDSVQFATYTRDSYTGLDYADQRFYASSYGRFLTPDRKAGKLSDPGSMNRYAYVSGDPINKNDPRGLCSVFLGGFTSNYDPSRPFTQIATAAGANQAYGFSGLSFFQSLGVWQGTQATNVALAAINNALQNNSGTVDIVAWSGGAAAFTNAYNELSAAQQQRIGNIIYVGPANIGSLASNSTTTVLLGTGWHDVGATSATTIPGSIDTTCDHNDFACFVQQAQAQFLHVQNDGSCNSPNIYTRQGQISVAALQNAIASAQQVQQVSSWWQNVTEYMPGLADAFLDWVDSIPVGGPDYSVDETITYDF